MTLNITCVGHGYVLQAADGRLSVNGRAIDGWWAKQLLLGCRDGVLLITWTGVGGLGDEPVDMWLGTKLSGAKAPEGSTDEAVTTLKDAADALVARLPPHKRLHTFVITGYSAARGKWRPLVWYVSNCLNDHLQTVGYVTGPFTARRGPRNPGELRVTGREDAVPPQVTRAVRKLLRPTVPPRRVQNMIARVISNVASRPAYREVVSQNSVSLLLERGKRPKSTFYPFDGDPVVYMPAVVWHAGGVNIVLAGGQHWGGPSILAPAFVSGDAAGCGMDVERAAGFPCDVSRIPAAIGRPGRLPLARHPLSGGLSLRQGQTRLRREGSVPAAPTGGVSPRPACRQAGAARAGPSVGAGPGSGVEDGAGEDTRETPAG